VKLKELTNIKSILKQLYENREKKILNLALNKSRTKSSLVDTSLLLKEEKLFFEKMVDLFDTFRDGVLTSIYSGKIPNIKFKENICGIKEKSSKQSLTKMIRFVASVPKFMGHDLQEYGPFEEEDMASLPIKLADILINKGRAEEIKEE